MRYKKMTMQPLGIFHLHRRNPWAAVWWSVACPGLGHLYLNAWLRSMLFKGWEIALNTGSHLNLAIYHTLSGNPEMARQVLDLRWAILYPPLYALAMWDTYQLAVENNKLYDLEQCQRRHRFQYHTQSFWGEAFLARRSPWMAMVMSTFVMGGGHFYIGQVLMGLSLMVSQAVIFLGGRFTGAVALTLLGKPVLAGQSVDYQWLLFWPGLQVFSMWLAYVDCVELNRLCENAKLYWLQQRYGSGK